MKYFYALFLASALLFSGAALVSAAGTGLTCTGGKCTYTPLEPLPVEAGAQNGTDFPVFVSGVFKVLITFGGLFAVVMLVVAGIGYMLSESSLSIDTAKDRAKAALWGLVILMGSWLVLNTINPDLLKFNIFDSSLIKLQNGTGAGSTITPASSPALTPAQLQALTSTYNAGTVTIDTTSGQAANDQEAKFRRECETKGGKVGAPISDGYNATYGCQVPNYMP